MFTKRELIEQAFGELALAGHEFDITPEEQQTALYRLDVLMATWEMRNIRLGYAMPATPGASDLDEDSGLPDSANEAAFMALAMRLAAGYGKSLSPDQRRIGREAFAPLLRAAAQPQSQQLPGGMPLGAGNRHGYLHASGPWTPQPDTNPLQVTTGGDLQFLGD